MTKYQYLNAIEREVKKLNETIDRKIVMGVDYSFEARRHRFLLARAKKLRRQSLFTRFFSFAQ